MTHPNENDKAEALDDFNKMVDFIHDIYPYHPNDFLMKRTIKTIRAALTPEPVEVDAEPAKMPEIIIAYTNSDRSKVSGSWVMKGVTFSLGDRPYSRYVRADLIPTAEPVRGDALEYDWKCNCCTTAFKSTQEQRTDDGIQNGGAKCPCCKADGQYTYRSQAPAPDMDKIVESVIRKVGRKMSVAGYHDAADYISSSYIKEIAIEAVKQAGRG